MARVLSFDVGFRHMSYCLLDFTGPRESYPVPEIIRWGTESLTENTKPTAADIIDAASDFVVQRPWIYREPDIVAIEAQVKQNPKMNKLAAALHGIIYTLARLVGNPLEVFYVKPKAKFEYFDISDQPPLERGATRSQKYKYRKDMAALLARQTLESWQTPDSRHMLEYFVECKQNPDMADSLTNGLAFARWKQLY